ncbi:hypothetical protein SteCoe_24000 [Stentor coeruleus]|uniref:RING-type domain-containing protein n=1 Tax=Stentor coeruleus TaxID=5963 RepID=A0A1R2BIM3_9CILI|nr:hypothetical protein SteCoe_24000 [Stentor coeruleus]
MKKITKKPNPPGANTVNAKYGNQPGGNQKKPSFSELPKHNQESYNPNQNTSNNPQGSYPYNPNYPQYSNPPPFYNNPSEGFQGYGTTNNPNIQNFSNTYNNVGSSPLQAPPSISSHNFTTQNSGFNTSMTPPNSNYGTQQISNPPPIINPPPPPIINPPPFNAPPPLIGGISSLTLPPQLINKTPSNIEPPPPINIPKFDLAKELCVYCKQSGVQLILPDCYHLCHLFCYVENNKCPECKGEERIIEIPYVVDMKKCALCRVESNLLACFNCEKQYCFICVNNKTIEGCCDNIKNSLDKYKSSCPGCFYTIGYDNFVPIKCKEHDALCKKCWNLSVAIGKCIIGCEIENSMAYYCHCEACDENEIKYFGEFVCPNNCEVCDFCQSIQILKCLRKKQEISCPCCENIED